MCVDCMHVMHVNCLNKISQTPFVPARCSKWIRDGFDEVPFSRVISYSKARDYLCPSHAEKGFTWACCTRRHLVSRTHNQSLEELQLRQQTGSSMGSRIPDPGLFGALAYFRAHTNRLIWICSEPCHSKGLTPVLQGVISAESVTRLPNEREPVVTSRRAH